MKVSTFFNFNFYDIYHSPRFQPWERNNLHFTISTLSVCIQLLCCLVKTPTSADEKAQPFKHYLFRAKLARVQRRKEIRNKKLKIRNKEMQLQPFELIEPIEPFEPNLPNLPNFKNLKNLPNLFHILSLNLHK